MIRKKCIFGTLIATILFMLVPFTTAAEVDITTPSGIPLTDLESSIDNFLQDDIGKTAPGLAIAVVKNGEVILLKGYGYADIENKIPVDPQNTVFELGSISKLFVWTSVMQLVEQGKINLDEDIKTYLPKEFSAKLKYKYPITMYDLMSHTAGFEQQPFDWLPISPEAIKPLEVTLIEHQPKQIYKPKEVIAYSNYGAALAGFIVEQISGKNFCDYEMENIFNPLDMQMTTGNPIILDKPQLLETKAKGYIKIVDSEFVPGIWSFLWHYPAGSVNGTVEDLSKYLLALMPENEETTPIFKDRETLLEMLSQSYSPHEGMASNAHGFWEHMSSDKSYWHPGNTASFSSFFAFAPEEGFGFAILTNEAYAYDSTYGLSKLLLGEPKSNAQPVNVTMPSAHDLAGLYTYSMRSKTGFYEAASYLANLVEIQAIDNKNINVISPGQISTYTQTNPYYYELQSTNNAEKPFVHAKLYVELKDGKVQRISGGHMMDILPLPKGRSLSYFWFSFYFAIASSLFFIISLAFILLKFIWRKIKPRDILRDIAIQNHFITAFVVLGASLILNNAYIILKSLIDIIPFLLTLKPHLFINWGILVLIICVVIFKFYYFKDLDSTRNQKVALFSVSTILILTIILLFNWNFFNVSF